MHFLVTGHTGFKGSWLTVLLKVLGHQVSGISLVPETRSLFNAANVQKYLDSNFYLDINDKRLGEVVRGINPDVLIHMAAQSLVLKSYEYPLETYQTNVMGTLRILTCTHDMENIKAKIIITSDKVYANSESGIPFKEIDPLGGIDPYSNSKACADLLTSSWAISNNDQSIAVARSGNVIGGGDFAENRLVPDLVNSIKHNIPLNVRHLNSIRPWQHVLDVINGYVTLSNHQMNSKVFDVWNFGPDVNETFTVSDLINNLTNTWGVKIEVNHDRTLHSEAKILRLDPSKSELCLGFENVLKFEEAIDWTVEWYKSDNPEKITLEQVKRFIDLC